MRWYGNKNLEKFGSKREIEIPSSSIFQRLSKEEGIQLMQ
jgi:hypothetical protein